MPFVVIYDACVLYPAPMRDFFVRLVTAGLFAAIGVSHPGAVGIFQYFLPSLSVRSCWSNHWRQKK